MTDGVVLAHDYVTQRGGAERVALTMAEAFPGSPMYTTLYDPGSTFPEFADVDLRVSPLDRVGVLRRNHRLALPFLAPTVSRQRVVGDVLLASSSGWAHGYRGAERTVVYCYAPARWLYQTDRYLSGVDGTTAAERARNAAAGAALGVLGGPLRAWDRRAAHRADTYVAVSSLTQRAIRDAYGIEAEIVPPPPALRAEGPESPVEGLEPGFLLCVARLLPYKNVEVAVRAALAVDGPPLVVVGTGPDRERLERLAGDSGRVVFVGTVDDAQLRWLYRGAALLVAFSYEDYGLTPLEAAAFGVPSVTLGSGGYLDTVVDGQTGTYVEAPDARLATIAISQALATRWDREVLVRHATTFGHEAFVARLREIVLAQGENPGRAR